MKPFSFVHASDLHIDRGFQGISNIDPDLGRKLYDSTFEAFDNIINLCIRERVKFLVVAGDVYEDQKGNLRAQQRFVGGLARLHENDILSFVAHGNHDPLNRWYEMVSWPDSARRFSGSEVQTFDVMQDDELLACVSGMSYYDKAVEENISTKFSRRPDAPFHIGVLHTNVGSVPEHANYAPCSIADLERADMDYWALGHVHGRRILLKDKPVVVYPGCSQGLSMRECGPRGCYLVKVSESGAVNLEFLETDVCRWETCKIDISGADTINDFYNRAELAFEELGGRSDGRTLMVRLEITGNGPLHRIMTRDQDRNEIVEQLGYIGTTFNQDIYLEKLIDSTKPDVDIEALRKEENIVSEFLRFADASREKGELRSALELELDELHDKPHIKRVLTELEDEDILDLISESETLGIDMLLGDEGQ